MKTGVAKHIDSLKPDEIILVLTCRKRIN